MRRVVVTSSIAAVIGEADISELVRRPVVDEDREPDEANPKRTPERGQGYSMGKVIAQRAFADAAAVSGHWDAITVCPGDNVGPIQSAHQASGGPWQHLIAEMLRGRCRLFQGTGPYRPWMTVDVRDDATCHVGLLESERVANGERYLAWSTETRSYEDIVTTIDRVLPALRHDPGPIVDESPERWKERGAEFRSIWAGLQLENERIRRRGADHVPSARRLDPRLRRVPHRGRRRRAAAPASLNARVRSTRVRRRTAGGSREQRNADDHRPTPGLLGIGYRFGRPYDPELPTLVMANSFSTSVELYRPQFADAELSERVNLLAIEPYGHGEHACRYADFTYWDSAIGRPAGARGAEHPRAFALGTSQGGWIAARMAMLAPDTVQGIIPLGTSMDFESERSRRLGCWDGVEFCTPAIDALAEPVGDDWVIPIELVDAVLAEGLGEDVDPATRSFWHAEHQRNYTGDAGRQRLRTISVNLRDRDGLHGRLDKVRCPVLWLQGTADRVYSVPNAEEEIGRFVNAANAELRVIEGGQHFLSATNPDVVNTAILEFTERWA